MNKTFKVFFSKIRGSMVVASEAASTPRKKGAKTVIAAALTAMAAGGAMAQEAALDPEPSYAVKSYVTISGGEVVYNKQTEDGGIDAATYGEAAQFQSAATVNEEGTELTLSGGSVSNFTGAMRAEGAQGANVGSIVTVESGQTLVIDDVDFIGNIFPELGDGEGKVQEGSRGVVSVIRTEGTVRNSRFEGNHSAMAGALDVFLGQVSVTDTDFVNNVSDAHAGAVRVNGGYDGKEEGEVEGSFTNVNFEGNKARLTGGALQVQNVASVNLENVQFSNNEANTSGTLKNKHVGGAVIVDGEGQLTGERVFFTGNKANGGNGGAIATAEANTAAVINLKTGSFESNEAAGGGAVALFGGNASFTDFDFTNNKATGWGGAVLLDDSASITIAAQDRDVVISGNTAGDADSWTGARYNGYTGGFMHLKADNTSAAFDVADGRTVTIGVAGQASQKNVDSITSEGANTTITKTGAGALVVNSNMEAFEGTLDVQEGFVTMATGFGTYSIHNQNAVNGGKSGADVASALKVGVAAADGAAAKTASVEITDAWSVNGTMGVTVNEGSSLTTRDVTVGKVTYTDLVEPAETPSTYEAVGKLTLTNSGTTTVNNLTVADGATLSITNTGSLYIDGTVNAGEAEGGATLTVNNANGTIYTDLANLGTYEFKDKVLTVDRTAFGSALNQGTAGRIVDQSVEGEMTLGQYSALTGGTSTSGFEGYTGEGFAGLVLSKVTVVNEDGSSLDVDQIYGMELPSTTVLGPQPGEDGSVTLRLDENASAVVDTQTVVANIDTGTATSVTVDFGSAGLTLAGTGGALFGDSVTEVNVKGEAGLTLGSDAVSSSGTLANVNVGDETSPSVLTVAHGDFTANNVNLSEGSTLGVNEGAALAVDEISGGQTTVDGSLAANVVAATNVAANGTLVIGARKADAEGNLNSQVNGAVNVDVGAMISTNAAAAGDYKQADKAVLYIDRQIALGEGASLAVGVDSADSQGIMLLAAPTSDGTTIGANGLAVVDLASFADGEQLLVNTALALDEGAQVQVLHVDKLASYVIADSVTGTVNALESDNLFLNVAQNETDANMLDVVYNQAATGENTRLANAVESVYQGGNAKNLAVLYAIGSRAAAAGDTALSANDQRAVSEYFTAPVTAGAYNVAYDSVELISNTIIGRSLEAGRGLGVWADVFYGSTEADEMYGASGYSADIYGGMLGVDFAFGEGARAGLALSIGSGDADSEGSVSKYSSDADFWGLSVYAGKDIGAFTITGDMSYVWFDNDISGTVAGVSASESIDSNVFTIGLRGDWRAYENDVLQVVPHIGVRWASIDVDDYRGLDMERMDVWELPIGVTVKGVIDTASGWTVQPAFDFTATPQLGDKEVSTLVGDVDVIDNLYNASIGVSAGTDTVRFGLSYKYGFGGDGRSDNTFNLKASYIF